MAKKGREALLYPHWACTRLNWAQAWPLVVGAALSGFFVLFLSECQARHQETRGVWRGGAGSTEDSSVGEVLAAGCKHIWLSGCCQTPAVVTLRDILPAVLGT